MINIFHIVLALLGISFLIFIHELGHYILARRAKMTVEVFSIGFGKPIHQWEVNGVKWQVCWFLVGGYVRIAGMEKQGNLEPYQIPDGYYGKKPWARIKVAAMGPLVNIVFAFLAFVIIWALGGQSKPFQRYTNVIGEIDPSSHLYEQGIRPGDEITAVGNKKVQGFMEVFFNVVVDEKVPPLHFSEIDYWTHVATPFSYQIDPTLKGVEAAHTLGIAPAQYLIFEDFTSAKSPMKTSGIQKKDRIVWADGELLFSKDHLNSVINQPRTLLTVRRQDQTLLTRVPRVKISDLRLDTNTKAELDDWQHEAGLSAKVGSLFFIPYNLSHDGKVESCLSYIDSNAEERCHAAQPRDPFDVPLQKGDQIIAIEGAPITSSSSLLKRLQTKQSLIVVQREKISSTPKWTEADPQFTSSFDITSLKELIQTIGVQPIAQKGDLVLLSPVELKAFSDLPMDENLRKQAALQYEADKRAIEKIEDPDVRARELLELEQRQHRLMLGVYLSDKAVAYNPSPFALFGDVFDQTWRSFLGLISGAVSPKYMAGPVSIVGVLQNSWNTGFKEALYWLGFISLNLAFINLLPIPVFDGGHIVFAIIESITKKPIKAKTMQRLILPFIILIIALFIYVTYHDLARILGQFL